MPFSFGLIYLAPKHTKPKYEMKMIYLARVHASEVVAGGMQRRFMSAPAVANCSASWHKELFLAEMCSRHFERGDQVRWKLPKTPKHWVKVQSWDLCANYAIEFYITATGISRALLFVLTFDCNCNINNCKRLKRSEVFKAVSWHWSTLSLPEFLSTNLCKGGRKVLPWPSPQF